MEKKNVKEMLLEKEVAIRAMRRSSSDLENTVNCLMTKKR